MKLEIKHDPENKTFVFSKDNLNAIVAYDILTENPLKIDIYKTFVPDDFRGKGIAGELMKEISEWALENTIKVIPTCSYSIAYYKKNKRYTEILAEESDLNSGGSCRIS